MLSSVANALRTTCNALTSNAFGITAESATWTDCLLRVRFGRSPRSVERMSTARRGGRLTVFLGVLGSGDGPLRAPGPRPFRQDSRWSARACCRQRRTSSSTRAAATTSSTSRRKPPPPPTEATSQDLRRPKRRERLRSQRHDCGRGLGNFRLCRPRNTSTASASPGRRFFFAGSPGLGRLPALHPVSGGVSGHGVDRLRRQQCGRGVEHV